MLRLIPALILAALVAGTAAQAQTLSQHCAPQPKVHLLLVDQTEAYDEVDKNRLAEGISQMVTALPGQSRLDVYTVADRPGALTADLRICVPGCGVGGQPACDDPVFRRHRQAFNGEVQRVMIRHVENAQAREKSELLRSLYFLSLEYEGRNVQTLTLFSDLIEYSDLNRTVSGFNSRSAGELMAKVKAKVHPGRAFGQASVRVFGFGKRLGSFLREEEQRQRQAQAEQVSQQYSRRKPGTAESRTGDIEMSTDSLRALSAFWYDYFTNLAKVQNVEIRLEY